MGSESTFVCGRIDLPGPQFPQGRVVLAWMGDSRLRLWGPAGELGTELGDQFKTEQRWSSLQGLVGDELHLFVRPLDQDGRRSILRLMVYSDGLFSLDEHSYSLSNLFVQDLIDRAGETATSDDISFLQVWLEPVPAQVESTPLLAPKWLHVRVRNGCLRAIWHSVSEATYYQIEVRADKMSEISPTDARYWTSLPLDPGQYSVRVRAMQNDNLGHWSEAREVEVPSPVSAILLPAPSVPETAPSVLPPPVRPVPTRRLSQTTWIAVGVGVLIVVSLIMLSSVLAFPENGPLHGLLFGATSTSTSTPTATFTPTTVRRATATITVTPIISTSTTTRTPTVTRTVAPTVSLTSTPSSTHTVTRISPISTLARATSQASQQAPAPKGSPAMTGSPGP